jgi:hypothetical protein
MDVDTIISLSLNVSGSSCGTIGMKALFFMVPQQLASQT